MSEWCIYVYINVMNDYARTCQFYQRLTWFEVFV
jgi:hypothetical protein